VKVKLKFFHERDTDKILTVTLEGSSQVVDRLILAIRRTVQRDDGWEEA